MLTDTSFLSFNESIVAWLSESRPLSRSTITLHEYQRAELDYLNQNESVSLYLHFPFCEKLCSYCDLNIAVTRDQKIRTEYLNALIEEIKTRIPAGKTLKELYLGGGTPSNLSSLNFEQLFSFLFDHFKKDELLQISIDAHPQDFSDELLVEKTHLLKKWGISEIKLGIEDTDENILQNLNRNNGKRNVHQLTSLLREKGFIVGGAFLVGLPGQTNTHLENIHHEILKTSLDYFTLRPLRLSSFNTQNMHLFGNGTTLSKEKMLKNMFQIHQRLKSDTSLRPLGFGFYSRAQKNLIRTELGFMSENFSSFLGFGVGSITSLGKKFQKQNPLHLNQYLTYAVNAKNLSEDIFKKDVRAYQLNPDELNALKKREDFVCNHQIDDVVHEIGRLEHTLELRLTENQKLNFDGLFFLEALVKEIR